MSAPITEASAGVLETAIARLHGAHDGDRIRTLHHSEAAALLAHIAALKQRLTETQHVRDGLNAACGQWKEQFDAKDAALQQARSALTASGELRICEYTLNPGVSDNLVHIRHASGESGQFSKAVLAEHLAKFWTEEF